MPILRISEQSQVSSFCMKMVTEQNYGKKRKLLIPVEAHQVVY